MKLELISGLGKKLYFTVDDVADLAGIKRTSAAVLCARYVDHGLFVRVKRNFYALESRWANYGAEEFMRLSNYIQVPSYVSFSTALGHYGATTQLQSGYFESALVKRSADYRVFGVEFVFHKLFW